jgi:hypothetical protein
LAAAGSDEFAPKTIDQMRRSLTAAYPRLAEILALTGRPADSSQALIIAADLLRHEIGYPQKRWYAAMEKHGWDAVVAMTVVAAARPGLELQVTDRRGLPARAGYLQGALRKPAAAPGLKHALRPWPSIYSLAEQVDLGLPSVKALAKALAAKERCGAAVAGVIEGELREGRARLAGLPPVVTAPALTGAAAQAVLDELAETAEAEIVAAWVRQPWARRLDKVMALNDRRRAAGEPPIGKDLARDGAAFGREAARWGLRP